MTLSLDPKSTLPTDATAGTLVGRVWRPELGGPSVVAIRADGVFDISRSFATMRDLCESPDPAASVAGAHADRIGDLAAILANTAEDKRDPNKPWLLAPIDLQAVKAAGVTFAISLLERVIEEQARGAPERAAQARAEVESALGGAVEKIKPGSPQAMELKKLLQAKGLWSQYLEVGIGPDAEIFTKCQVHGRGRHRHVDRRARVLDLEQSRARGRGRRHLEGQDRRRDARQRREPARRRRPLGAAALQGEGQQRLDARSARSSACSTRPSRSTTCAARASRSP